MKKPIQITITRHKIIFATKGGKQRTEEVKPLYRVATGHLPSAPEKLYTIVDKKFTLGYGQHEICLHKPTEKEEEKLPEYDQWKGTVKGTLVFLEDVMNSKEEFKTIHLKGKVWREMLDKFIDDTKEGKDIILTNLAKSHTISIPRRLMNFQKYNNHAICETQTKTAKTETYKRIMGEIPKQDPTVAGMIGSVESDRRTVIRGSLEGCGLAVYDEFPERNDPIVNHILNYLQSSETTRDIVSPVYCKGNKTVIFLGNYDKLTEDDFLTGLCGLATSRALDRIGSRFAHIIFAKLKQVKPQSSDEEVVQYMRSLIQSTLNQNERKIVSLMKYAEKWFTENDPDYTEKVEDCLSASKNEDIRVFLQGCELHTPRLKMAGLKKAIAENLDRIVLDYSVALKNEILQEAKENYELFKRYNLLSFNNFGYDEKAKFRIMFERGEDRESIMEACGISRMTFFRWKKEYQVSPSSEAYDERERYASQLDDT